MTRLIPGQTPDTPIRFHLINGTEWDLSRQSDDMPWRLVVVYRGLHCPLCKKQLSEISGKLDKFKALETSVVAVSMDTEERANKAHQDWELDALPIGYELSSDLIDHLGLYVSKAIKDEEPDEFTEPGLFLFKGETLHAAWVQSLPMARPEINALLSGIEFLQEKDYPARGDLKEAA